MKKHLLLLIYFLEVCLPILSNPITAELAHEKASQFLNSSTFGKRHKAQALARSLRMASIGKNESYYVFNIGEDEGFVIVNGEDDMEEIIGYSEEGTFDKEEMPENMKAWLQSYTEQIEWARTHKNNIVPKRAKANSYEYEDFMLDQTKVARWGQSGPFSGKCPRVEGYPTITGCAPTALAQLLYWFKQPSTIPTTIPAYPEFDLKAVSAGTIIDWNHMKQHDYEYTETAERDAVAWLMLYCGQAIKANYKVQIIDKLGYPSTSGKIFFMPYALCKYFGFKDELRCVNRNDYENEEWKWLVYSEIRKNHPVLYGGSSPTSGHAFILEGYKDGRFYVNWGWNSKQNGYFQLDLLNGHDHGYVGYDIRQAALVNIEPGGNASQYTARLTTMTLSVDQQTVNRTSNTSNFPAFKVTAKAINQNPETLDFKEGFGLYKDGKLIGSTWTTDSKIQLGPEYSVTYSKNISINGVLDDGVYHLCPTSCESSFGNMKENLNSGLYYIKVTKLGNDLTLETIDPSRTNLTLSKFEPKPNSVFKVNRLLDFDIAVSNNDTQPYTGDVKLCQKLIDNAGNEFNRVVAITHLDIGANGAAAFSLKYIPMLEGTQVIRILDKNNKILGSQNINIEHGENMEFSDWDIVNGDLQEQILLGTTLNGTVKIKNNDSQSFDGNVWFELIDTNSPMQNGQNVSYELQLAPEEKKAVRFNFNDLTEGQTYRISVRFDDSEEVCSSELFTCKHLDTSTLTTGDYFTAETVEGVTVNYLITDINRRTVSVMGVDGATAVDEYTSGSVTLPAIVKGFLVTGIGEGAFAYLKYITQVYIPPTVKMIGRQAFFYCSELTYVDGMEGVEVIDEIAFRLCGKIKQFNLPSTLTTIKTQAFGSCTSLESIVIPASVRWIEPNGENSYKLFEGCSNLKTIIVDEANPYYDSRENCNAIVETATNTLYAGCRTTKIVDGIERIGNFAFGFVDNIGTIEIPASVTSIGKYAFAQCTNLNNVKIWQPEPFAIEDNVFTDPSQMTLYVPSGSKAKYAETDVWKDFGLIKEFPVFDQEIMLGLQLVIYFNDGRSLSYSLNDHPLFKLLETEVLFTTDHTELTFKGSEVSRFVIENRDETFDPDAISTNKMEVSSSFVEGQLRISGTVANTPVHIYTTNGIQIFSGATSSSGTLFIDTSDYKPGIYIVNMGETSIKLMKK